jgi:hypothetical protein
MEVRDWEESGGGAEGGVEFSTGSRGVPLVGGTLPVRRAPRPGSRRRGRVVRMTLF